MDLSEIFKKLVWDTLVTVAIKQLFAAVPWLGWGPVGVIVGWVGGLVADQIYKALDMMVALQLIVIKNKALAKDFAAAALTLKEIGQAKGIDSPEFKEARDEHKKRLAELIHFGG